MEACRRACDRFARCLMRGREEEVFAFVLPNYEHQGTCVPVERGGGDVRAALAPHLEYSARDVVWERIYDLATCGASTRSLAAALDARRQGHRLLVVEDAEGAAFGGVWHSARADQCSLVYTWEPGPASIKVHAAARAASVLLTKDSFSIGLNSGAGVAFWIDDALDYGFSSPSEQFQSPVLASTHNFRCVRFEVWAPRDNPLERH